MSSNSFLHKPVTPVVHKVSKVVSTAESPFEKETKAEKKTDSKAELLAERGKK